MPDKFFALTDKFTVPEHPAGNHHNFTNSSIICRHQTFYGYDASNYFVSDNLIRNRLIYKEFESLVPEYSLPNTVIDGFIPKNSFAVSHIFGDFADLTNHSGFFVDYDASSNEGIAGFLRIIFFEKDAENDFNTSCEGKVRTFMSSAPLRPGDNRAFFSTDKLSFPENIGKVKIEVVSTTLCTRLTVTVRRICMCDALDYRMKFRGQASFYETDGELTQRDDRGLELRFNNGFTFTSPEFPNNNRTVFNMLMPRRNTIFAVIGNYSDVSELTVRAYSRNQNVYEKNFRIEPYSDKKAYFFNLSDIPGLSGRLSKFSFSAENGSGSILIYSYSFEEEKIIEETAGESVSCVSDGKMISINALLKSPAVAGSKALLYRTSMADGEDVPAGKTLIASKDLTEGDKCLSFTTPHKYGTVTELSSQFIIFIQTGSEFLKFSDRFYIDNARDFVENKYEFSLKDEDYNVLDFGAKGDAFTDDTEAIQKAIDACSSEGGGRVILPGTSDFYGRRYIATALVLRSNVDLHFEDGAVLWQSQDQDEYPYIPAYGHDGYIEGVNWTHCMHVCNLPLIHCHNSDNVKITGHGKIRLMDTGSEEGVGIPGYTCGCPDRIHIISIGFFNVHNLNLEDFEIVRTNNYHMSLYHCDRGSVIGLKMHQVKCVSGDGVGLGQGSHDFILANLFFQSNDDGVTISSSYNDPREILWWCGIGEGVCATRNVEVCHCYFNSGGGKCIAFIPWGTVQTYGELATIKNIHVYDCFLSSVNPVGAWADDPFRGRYPFDNAEENDYGPVQNVRIHDNIYNGNNKVYPLVITDFISDCGLYSPSDFRNGDFSLGGFANWSICGNIKHYFDKVTGREAADIIDGAMWQGLYLEKGHYKFGCALKDGYSALKFIVKKSPESLETGYGEIPYTICREITDTGNSVSVEFDIPETGDYYVGIETKDAVALSFKLDAFVDREQIKRERIEQFMGKMSEKVTLNDECSPNYRDADGKIYLGISPKYDIPVRLVSKKKYTDFSIDAAFRLIGRAWQKPVSYGYEAVSEKAVYRMLLDEAGRRLVLTKEADGKTEVLYEKPDFFFTSDDFHFFRLDRSEDGKLTVFVDNGLYTSVETGDTTEATVAPYFDNSVMEIHSNKFLLD